MANNIVDIKSIGNLLDGKTTFMYHVTNEVIDGTESKWKNC